MDLKCKRLDVNAKLPTKANALDAGFDLYAIEATNVGYLSTKIRTGISVEIPDGYFGMICSRSSMGAKGLQVLGGIIDSGYRGEVIVMLASNCSEFNKINVGDKIAQMVILPVPDMQIVESNDLNDSERGNKGFGSSGI